MSDKTELHRWRRIHLQVKQNEKQVTLSLYDFNWLSLLASESPRMKVFAREFLKRGKLVKP